MSFCFNSIGQTTIYGIVKNKSTQKPTAFAFVGLFEKDSTTIIDQVYTDSVGRFKLTFHTNPIFIVKVRRFGYFEFNTKLSTKNTSDSLWLTVELEEDINLLNEVTVIDRQGFITLQGDRITYNIDRAGIGIGNSTLEVLDRVPGLKLDKDDNVIFRGSGVQILINGRKPLMQGEALTQYLKTLNGEAIKSVEIISNPSSKYDASGSGGIINIVLKTNNKKGFSGIAYGKAGYAEFGKLSTGINLYHQKDEWNINIGGYYGYFESVNHRRIIQQNNVGLVETELDQINDWFPKSKVINGKFGLEYLASKNNTFGTSWNFKQYLSDETTIGRTNESINSELLNYTTLHQEAEFNEQVITGSVFYDYISDSADASLSFQLNYANYNEAETQNTLSQFFNANTNQPSKIPDDNIYKNPKKYALGSVKVDGSQIINKKLSFEYGTKWNYINNHYNILIERITESGIYVQDELLSNQLSYKESIASAYSSLSLTIKNWNAQIGLRGEGIAYTVSANKKSNEISGKNISLFPSFSVNKSLENHQFKWSYSRRVNRPSYLDRNPFFRYIDTYNISIGNPSLAPEYSNVFDFTWIIKENSSISVFANHKGDAIFHIISYDNASQTTTLYKDNIAVEKGGGLSVTTEKKLVNWWTVQLYGEVMYNQSKSELEGFSFDLGGFNGHVSLNQTFYLKKDWRINWSAFYATSGVYGNSLSLPSYDMSFSVKKSFFDEKLKVKLRAQDIFMTNRYRSITSQGDVTTNWTNRWETRKFTLSVSYSFGNGKRKSIKSTDLGDEKDRL